jgi:hypothetical protein
MTWKCIIDADLLLRTMQELQYWLDIVRDTKNVNIAVY